MGFGKDMGATRSLRDTDHSGQAMEATAGALLEADRRMTDPPRRFKFWRKVPSWMPDEVCEKYVCLCCRCLVCVVAKISVTSAQNIIYSICCLAPSHHMYRQH